MGNRLWHGGITTYLPKEVGEASHVYAIDMSEELLAVAKEKVKAEGLKNVTFIHGDIRSQENLPVGGKLSPHNLQKSRRFVCLSLNK